MIMNRHQNDWYPSNISGGQVFPYMDHAVDAAYYFMRDNTSVVDSSNTNGRLLHPFDISGIRSDFPILQRRVNGKPLIWLDNGATTQKPQCVIDALREYYQEYNSNVHRGAHTLSKEATDAYECARRKVQMFLGASAIEEIIFVRGATEAINLVAQTYGSTNIRNGDEILLTMMEHHSNIVPWQMLQKEKGAVMKVIPINGRGEIMLDEYEKLLSSRTRVVAITHVSNVLGTINPIRKMIDMAHRYGARVLIDGAQAAPHLKVNVQDLDADFYVFSGHKAYGPTGIGVLYGKKGLLEQMPPWQKGGGMIKNVTFDGTTYNNLPDKFEAGTGSIADAVGLRAAIDYMQKVGMDRIEHYERSLTGYAMQALSMIPGVNIIGTAPDKISAISFVVDGVSPETVATRLDREGIAVRIGHHCAQPVLQRFNIKSTIRASLAMYNIREEIDMLANTLYKITKDY
ncbi:cysteine desulfurase [Petroclostridium sp. X23]|uniref:cysteine desulfurase n=1 Tax=Petroclostridium sp. X23 TaxID=3045146 RepID=UPI0024AE1E6A|nr:cysteine desulfurase [Petroclostridium sp. X23]WHH58824.1 cysteine desulfurase [Petroclostridium sp. X23]